MMAKSLPIKDYEDTYSITETGVVISRPRPTTSGGPLKPVIGTDGYQAVMLSRNGKVKRHKVHHLVAEAFIGPRPKGMCVDHIDNNRVNNSASNLEYVTMRENSIRGQRCKLNKSRTSEYTVVFKRDGKWSACKAYGSIQYNLGVFKTELDAHRAYESATEESCKAQREERQHKQSSQHKGVSYDKARNKWAVYIKRKFIGRFDTEKEAVYAIRKQKHRKD